MNQENNNPPAPTTVVRTTGNGEEASMPAPVYLLRPNGPNRRSRRNRRMFEKKTRYRATFFFYLRISNMTRIKESLFIV